MLIRTSAGLASEHLFHEVEFVVYCEGKALEGEASSLDQVFWQRIFSENGKNVYCKSVGSKSVLLPLAEMLISDGISNVLIALDRDYDDLRGDIIEHPQVIYTFGYSLESDVMLGFDFDTALAMFITTNSSKAIHDDFKVFYQSQSKQCRRVFAIDYKYIGHTMELFNRQKPQSIVSSGRNFEPCVNIGDLLETAKTMGRFQTGPLPREDYRTACGIRSFFGKTVAKLIFMWFIYRTNNIDGRRKAHYEMFMNLLTHNLNVSDLANPRNNYYSEAVARI